MSMVQYLKANKKTSRPLSDPTICKIQRMGIQLFGSETSELCSLIREMGNDTSITFEDAKTRLMAMVTIA